jgi:hypothetical protein
MQTYWLFNLMERAKTTDPEKIIKLWRGTPIARPTARS